MSTFGPAAVVHALKVLGRFEPREQSALKIRGVSAEPIAKRPPFGGQVLHLRAKVKKAFILTCELKGRARGVTDWVQLQAAPAASCHSPAATPRKEGSQSSSSKAARHMLVSKKAQGMKNAYRKRILERAKTGQK